MAELRHSSSRLVDQRPAVVHDRLLELAVRLRDEAPPIEPGTQAASLLGVTGPLGIEIGDRGPNRIELRTTQGRIRGQGGVDIRPAAGDRTEISMAVEIKPDGFAANLMLGAAMKMMPNVEQQVIDGLERGLDDLAVELAKPDGEWDASTWEPPGLPRRR
jgi:hypothetical protein